jgi:hypothetical protein
VTYRFAQVMTFCAGMAVLSGTLAFAAAESDPKALPAPPRTPQTGIDPGIQVHPGPTPDPHTAVPPKSNPDPGMAIDPDAALRKNELSPGAIPPADVRPPDRMPETRPDTPKQQ